MHISPPFGIISDLFMTLTSDLLTSKSNQFIFIPNCIKMVNMLKFLKLLYKISRLQTVRTHTHTAPWTHRQTTQKHNEASSIQRRQRHKTHLMGDCNSQHYTVLSVTTRLNLVHARFKRKLKTYCFTEAFSC